jgi:hypothetical protein
MRLALQELRFVVGLRTAWPRIPMFFLRLSPRLALQTDFS